MLREGLIRLGGSSTAETLVRKTPLRAMSRRFVPGETVEELVEAIRQANADGLEVTANFLGEAEHSRRSCREAGDTYLRVMDHIAREGLDAGISVKFTQLGQEIGDDFLRDNLTRLLERGREEEIFIRFDMESSEYTQRTLDAFEALWNDGWRHIGVVLQSYLRRTEEDVRRMNRLDAPVRLCKGAYAEPAEIAYQERRKVDRSFVRCAELLLSGGRHPAIATHDERMIDATVEFASRNGIAPNTFEFQMLHGVRRDLQQELLEDGYRVRVYIPFGRSWYPYLMRRLAERPANVLFLAGSVIQESPLGFLWPSGDDGNGGGRR